MGRNRLRPEVFKWQDYPTVVWRRPAPRVRTWLLLVRNVCLLEGLSLSLVKGWQNFISLTPLERLSNFNILLYYIIFYYQASIMYFKLFHEWTSLELERMHLMMIMMMMMMGKERYRVLRGCQNGDVWKEGKLKEEKKEERAGNRIGLLSSHVWTSEGERRQVGERMLKASRVGECQTVYHFGPVHSRLKTNYWGKEKSIFLGGL